ncbi:MAG TPA: TetR/AcrR family transcriptional regulator [Kineosporiaceae bacterium]
MATVSAKGTRLNRRGLETRQTLLRVAVRCLAVGGPDVLSANRVAREAGLTWGTVQHQFGDSDGLWAAVLDSVADRGPGLLPVPDNGVRLEARVAAVVDRIWEALDKPSLRAVHNLRISLPHQRAELEQDYPRTAAALAAWDVKWRQALRSAFAGLPVDTERLDRLHSFLPGAVRGLHEEQYLSSLVDVAEARRGLVEAISAYLR